MSGNRVALVACSGVLAALDAAPAAADYAVNFQPPVTPVAADIYDLHMLVFWICVVIGAAVFSVMFYAIFRYRKSAGAQAAHFHENTAVEVIWTIVPFLILVGLAIPATRTLIAMEDTRDADLTVKVTGYQWKWNYDYLDDGISFFSTLSTPGEAIENRAPKGEHYLLEVDHELVLPVGKKVRFLITAHDVIHSWWVPALGVKKDAIPGYINESWAKIEKPGVYRGQCAELCGVGHGFMPIVVRAVSEGEYKRWIAQQKAAAPAPTPTSGESQGEGAKKATAGSGTAAGKV
jgi:cytochrome c oxidase subunit 2